MVVPSHNEVNRATRFKGSLQDGTGGCENPNLASREKKQHTTGENIQVSHLLATAELGLG